MRKGQPVSGLRRGLQGAALMALVALVAIAALVWQQPSTLRLPGPAAGGEGRPAAALPVAREGTPAAAPPVARSTQAETGARPPGAGRLVWPVEGTLTQTYWSGHQAIDVANREGTPVYAAADGIVVEVGRLDVAYGNCIVLDHGDGLTTFYAHLRAIYVRAGEAVGSGQPIGAVGSTGYATGPHLHFEVRQDGRRLNPLEVLPEGAADAAAGPAAGPAAWLRVTARAPLTDASGGAPQPAGLVWPVSGEVSQVYWSGHQALDIAAPHGTPVYAAAAGTVRLAGRDDARQGLHLLLDHGDGLETFYSHLSTIEVEVGQAVAQGQRIGAVGETGQASGPHLHFEVRRDGAHVDPLKMYH